MVFHKMAAWGQKVTIQYLVLDSRFLDTSRPSTISPMQYNLVDLILM
jgi:hypothetical protein